MPDPRTLCVAGFFALSLAGCGSNEDPRVEGAPDSSANCPLDAEATSGELQSAFGDNGKLDINPSPRLDSVGFALVLDGRDLYLSGGDQTPGTDDYQTRIEKRDRCTGALIAPFGNGGVVTSDNGPFTDAVGVVAVASGSLYLVGADESLGAVNAAWRVEKRAALDGKLDGSFGEGGVASSNPSDFTDVALFAVIDAESLYVAGFDSAAGEADQGWRIEKRRLLDGGLVEGFGNAGVITENPGPMHDHPAQIAIDSGFLYIAGNDSTPGDDEWRIEKRDVTDGSLVSTFGTEGVITFNPTPGPESVTAMALLAPFIYIAGVEGVAMGDLQPRIEKRKMEDGALVGTFGVDGAVTTNPTPGLDRFLSMAVDSQALYLFGTDNANGGPEDYEWRTEKRSLDDGSLVTSFADSGVVSENFTPGDEWGWRIAVGSDSVYLLGDYLAAAPDDYGWHLQRRAK